MSEANEPVLVSLAEVVAFVRGLTDDNVGDAYYNNDYADAIEMFFTGKGMRDANAENLRWLVGGWEEKA